MQFSHSTLILDRDALMLEIFFLLLPLLDLMPNTSLSLDSYMKFMKELEEML